MKILLDENLPHELRHFLPRHEVFTAAYKGWAGVKNGELLRQAAAEGFDAIITLDRGIQHEQNLATLPLSVIALGCKTNKLIDIMPVVPSILVALDSLQPQTFVKVP